MVLCVLMYYGVADICVDQCLPASCVHHFSYTHTPSPSLPHHHPPPSHSRFSDKSSRDVLKTFLTEALLQLGDAEEAGNQLKSCCQRWPHSATVWNMLSRYVRW